MSEEVQRPEAGQQPLALLDQRPPRSGETKAAAVLRPTSDFAARRCRRRHESRLQRCRPPQPRLPTLLPPIFLRTSARELQKTVRRPRRRRRRRRRRSQDDATRRKISAATMQKKKKNFGPLSGSIKSKTDSLMHPEKAA